MRPDAPNHKPPARQKVRKRVAARAKQEAVPGLAQPAAPAPPPGAGNLDWTHYQTGFRDPKGASLWDFIIDTEQANFNAYHDRVRQAQVTEDNRQKLRQQTANAGGAESDLRVKEATEGDQIAHAKSAADKMQVDAETAQQTQDANIAHAQNQVRLQEMEMLAHQRVLQFGQEGAAFMQEVQTFMDRPQFGKDDQSPAQWVRQKLWRMNSNPTTGVLHQEKYGLQLFNVAQFMRQQLADKLKGVSTRPISEVLQDIGESQAAGREPKADDEQVRLAAYIGELDQIINAAQEPVEYKFSTVNTGNGGFTTLVMDPSSGGVFVGAHQPPQAQPSARPPEQYYDGVTGDALTPEQVQLWLAEQTGGGAQTQAIPYDTPQNAPGTASPAAPQQQPQEPVPGADPSNNVPGAADIGAGTRPGDAMAAAMDNQVNQPAAPPTPGVQPVAQPQGGQEPAMPPMDPAQREMLVKQYTSLITPQGFGILTEQTLDQSPKPQFKAGLEDYRAAEGEKKNSVISLRAGIFAADNMTDTLAFFSTALETQVMAEQYPARYNMVMEMLRRDGDFPQRFVQMMRNWVAGDYTLDAQMYLTSSLGTIQGQRMDDYYKVADQITRGIVQNYRDKKIPITPATEAALKRMGRQMARDSFMPANINWPQSMRSHMAKSIAKYPVADLENWRINGDGRIPQTAYHLAYGMMRTTGQTKEDLLTGVPMNYADKQVAMVNLRQYDTMTTARRALASETNWGKGGVIDPVVLARPKNNYDTDATTGEVIPGSEWKFRIKSLDPNDRAGVRELQFAGAPSKDGYYTMVWMHGDVVLDTPIIIDAGESFALQQGFEIYKRDPNVLNDPAWWARYMPIQVSQALYSRVGM